MSFEIPRPFLYHLSPDEERARRIFESDIGLGAYQAVGDRFAVDPTTGQYLDPIISERWQNWYASWLEIQGQ